MFSSFTVDIARDRRLQCDGKGRSYFVDVNNWFLATALRSSTAKAASSPSYARDRGHALAKTSMNLHKPAKSAYHHVIPCPRVHFCENLPFSVWAPHAFFVFYHWYHRVTRSRLLTPIYNLHCENPHCEITPFYTILTLAASQPSIFSVLCRHSDILKDYAVLCSCDCGARGLLGVLIEIYPNISLGCKKKRFFFWFSAIYAMKSTVILIYFRFRLRN